VELGAGGGAAGALSLELEDEFVSAVAAVLLESAFDSVAGESFFDSVVESLAGEELLPA